MSMRDNYRGAKPHHSDSKSTAGSNRGGNKMGGKRFTINLDFDDEEFDTPADRMRREKRKQQEVFTCKPSSVRNKGNNDMVQLFASEETGPKQMENTAWADTLAKQSTAESIGERTARNGTNMRRKDSSSVDVVDDLHITNLPDDFLADVGTYLSKPSRALFSAAMTAPSASWRKVNWARQPSVTSRAIVSSSPSDRSKMQGKTAKRRAVRCL